MYKSPHPNKVNARSIELDRYYPPTTETINLANLDIDHYAHDGNIDGLKAVFATALRVSYMASDESDVQAFSDISDRARSLADEQNNRVAFNR